MSHDLYPELRRHNLLRTFLMHRIVADTVAGEVIETETLELARSHYLKQRGLESEDAIKTYLTVNGLTNEDLEWQIALPAKIRKHCERNYKHKAEAHFLKRKNQLDQIVYSLLRVKDACLAKELYLRIDAREATFADLAGRYSEGAEKRTNGVIGPVPLTQAHPVLAEMLRTAQKGELLHPFQIADWWLVVRLENYTPACFDEATAQDMSEELFNQWASEETSLIIRKMSQQGVALVQE